MQKTAVVFGATRLGAILAQGLAPEYHVVLHYFKNKEAAVEAATAIRQQGGSATVLSGDVADYTDVEMIAAAVGAVDLVVNCADYFYAHPFPDPLEDWRKAIAVSIHGSFHIARAFQPKMASGSFIYILDNSIRQAWPNFTAHAVSKAGIAALIRQLALEFAPNVRVNGIALGPLLPPNNWSAKKAAAFARRTLLGRWGQPADLVQAVKFLAGAHYIIGEIITVDGGEQVTTPPPTNFQNS